MRSLRKGECREGPQGSKGPKYRVCRAFVFGIVAMFGVDAFYVGAWTLRGYMGPVRRWLRAIYQVYKA